MGYVVLRVLILCALFVLGSSFLFEASASYDIHSLNRDSVEKTPVESLLPFAIIARIQQVFNKPELPTRYGGGGIHHLIIPFLSVGNPFPSGLSIGAVDTPRTLRILEADRIPASS